LYIIISTQRKAVEAKSHRSSFLLVLPDSAIAVQCTQLHKRAVPKFCASTKPSNDLQLISMLCCRTRILHFTWWTCEAD